MNVTRRTKDIVSGTEDLEFVFQLKNFPVFQGCSDQPIEHDIVHDLSFYIGKSTGVVQSQELLPLDVVYRDAHTPGAVGQIWMDHHQTFANFIHRARPTSVLEIGGSHGILSQLYDNLELIDWTIIEPAPVANPNLRARLVKGFFDANTDIEADMVVHSHVLEHIYDPADFFAALSRRPQGSKMCFSIPALEQHIAQMYTNALSFEHTYFCTEDFVEYWLAQSGYAIVDKQHFKGHSIFYSTVRSEVEAVPMPDVYAVNKKLFDQFVAHHQHNVDTLNAAVKASTVPVYLFGAHVFSQFLLSMGLDESKIVAVLDNSQAKQGRRLYGSKLMCYSPEALAHVKDAVVILQAGQYTEEIRSQILEINSGIKFI
jgi:C-methyltransferase C-terminal domain/Methyltransferase domain